MTDTVDGYRVLERGRSRDPRFPWVVLCERIEITDGGERYAVWYEDRPGRRSIGHYTNSRDDAQSEFERRT